MDLPSHRALLIPELLENILSFMNRDDNVINACVCKQQSEIALDLIQWEVENLLQLLALLCKAAPNTQLECVYYLQQVAKHKGLGEISENIARDTSELAYSGVAL
ncbi:hypothetical protein AZE42_12396 [Rhizopogon vesiculosus]|uniref:Uncharacterized protein n=1 Tax=Rhizopogon vesiculosus TaxID=180088 RepID=A0A1J8QKS8_9AGAM|nr:hypothetical protein AZE42_12396 [Rhizopogon vesiculosus]